MTEHARPDRGNKKHSAPVPENIEPGLAQAGREFLHHLGRRTRFLGPRILDRAAETAVRESPAQNTADGQLIRFAEQLRQIRLAKVTFSFGITRERDGWLLPFRPITGYVPRLLFPFLDHRRITHDFDLTLIVGEAHPPAEARFVKTAELRLIGVMIRRTEERPAQPAAGHVRKIAL